MNRRDIFEKFSKGIASIFLLGSCNNNFSSLKSVTKLKGFSGGLIPGIASDTVPALLEPGYNYAIVSKESYNKLTSINENWSYLDFSIYFDPSGIR